MLLVLFLLLVLLAVQITVVSVVFWGLPLVLGVAGSKLLVSPSLIVVIVAEARLLVGQSASLVSPGLSFAAVSIARLFFHQPASKHAMDATE
jgi:hypothetical protein